MFNADDGTLVQLDFAKALTTFGPRNEFTYELTKFMDFTTLYRLSRSENILVKEFFRHRVWEKRFIEDFGAEEFQKYHGTRLNWLWMYSIYHALKIEENQIEFEKKINDDVMLEMSVWKTSNANPYHLIYSDNVSPANAPNLLTAIGPADDDWLIFRSLEQVRHIMYQAFVDGFVLVWNTHEPNSFKFEKDYISCRVCNKVATLQDRNRPTHYYCSYQCGKMQ